MSEIERKAAAKNSLLLKTKKTYVFQAKTLQFSTKIYKIFLIKLHLINLLNKSLPLPAFGDT